MDTIDKKLPRLEKLKHIKHLLESHNMHLCENHKDIEQKRGLIYYFQSMYLFVEYGASVRDEIDYNRLMIQIKNILKDNQ